MPSTAYWSLWVRVPAYLVGIVIFGALGLYAFYLTVDGKHKNNSFQTDWRGILLFAFIWVAAAAEFIAWDERRVIAKKTEWFFAHLFHYAISLGTIGSGGFIGYKVYKKSSRQWAGWVVGIIIGILVGASIYGLASNIPGVNWRLELISDESD